MADHPQRFVVENALLLAASHVQDQVPPRRTALDLAYLGRAADRQGVAPLLHTWLQRHPGTVEDAAFAAQLHDTYWAGHFRNRLLLAELREVVGQAHAAGVDIIPLKGAQLAPHCYPSPALRPLSDLDLLIRPRDVAALAALLKLRGYMEVDHAPSYVEDDRLDLDSRDYCWFAVREGVDALIEFRVAPLELAVGRLTDLDPSYTDALRAHAHDVWDRSVASPDGAGRVMSPEDVLLHVTTHLAAKHLDFRLIWLHDIARLLLATPGLDWDYVAAQSTSLRVAAPVAAALEAARRYVGAPVTDAQLAQVRQGLGPDSVLSLPHRDDRRLMRYVDALPSHDLTIDGPGIWPLGAALSRVRGWPARLRVMRWVLLPGREYLEHRGTAGRGAFGRVSGSLTRLVRRARGRGVTEAR